MLERLRIRELSAARPCARPSLSAAGCAAPGD
jgi:hypothetical protein